MPSVIYRSPRLLVKAVHRGSECCVVTFDSFTDTTNLDRRAFGEEFLARHGISAVHVVNGRNSWYHEPDWQEAIGAARDASRGHARILTYGSSMGGYAALRFAEAIGATHALAFSPQYSGDPRKAPFEKRWAVHRRRKWLPELSGPLPSAIPAVVVYDPVMKAERLHVERIAAEMPVRKLALPHAGHYTAAVMSECGVLSELALQMVAGRADLIAIGREARARRKQSLHYLMALSDDARRTKHHAAALAIARRAVDAAPDSHVGWHHLSQLLSGLKRHDEALEAARRSVALAPDETLIRWRLAEAQRAVGHYDEALETLGVFADKPMTPENRRKIDNMTWLVRLQRRAARLVHAIRRGAT